MYNVLKLVLCLCLAGVSYAKTEAEIKAWFVTLGIECTKDYPISSEEMIMMHQHKPPKSENGKCLMACVYRKAGWMDAKGTFDDAKAYAMLEKDHVDAPDKLEKSKKLIEMCKKVNDETFSDGEKGCERAVRLSACVIDNAPKLGLQLA